MMVLKDKIRLLLFFTLLTSSSAAVAQHYRPEEFLTLDLSRALLSPQPLGPPTQFEPVAVEAKGDPTSSAPVTSETASGNPASSDTSATNSGALGKVHAVTAAPVRFAKRHGAVRTRLAHKHGNPLDAQAFDARIQVWPCKSGGICNWRR
jgi:hypothetical protein